MKQHSKNDSKKDRSDLSIRIEKLVKSLNISQADFATKLNTSPSYISKLISGTASPGTDLLQRIGTEFNVNLD